jgi:thiol-disulfide isomerase/thioredoxin
MSSISLGPFVLPTGAVLLFLALGVAAVTGWLAGGEARARVATRLVDLFVVALIVARVAFVLRWIEIYREAPLTALDLRDGGFDPWAGVAAVLVLAAWQAWRKPALRRALAAGATAGLMAWGGGSWLLQAIQSSERPVVPSLELATLEGAPVAIASLAKGRPSVVNLWATWCPPCRREMPVLAKAQRREPGVVFVFANQREGSEIIRRYLEAEGLELRNVLLDAEGRLPRETGSPGLPTTLFYDAQGRLVDAHMGALSEASLAAKLARVGVLQPSQHTPGEDRP